MRFWLKWLGVGLVALALLAAAAVFALWRWTSTEDFRLRAEREASQAVGLPVKLGRLQLSLWPLPAVAVEQVVVQSQPPLTLQSIEATPVWRSLLGDSPALAELAVRRATLPQPAIAAIAASLQKKKQAAPGPRGPEPDLARRFPRRLVLEEVTWVDARGRPMTLNAQARLLPEGGALESASAEVVAGRFAGARADLRTEGEAWALKAQIGGGTIAGPLTLSQRPASWLLEGRLVTQNVEVAALTAPAKPLSGRLDAQTTLQAEFRDPGAITDVLRSQTRFTVRQAVVHGLDLAQAVKSVGTSRGGQTALDTLAGQLNTQGRAMQLTNLVASSGLLAASGQLALAPDRSLSGRVTVELGSASLGGALGVPLVVGGNLDSPTVTLSRAALLGAAVGTAVTPGVGTAAGAKLGEKLRGLFGK
ncbi:MAG TPA: hypothetical protein VEA35_15335 [Ramlibacter sp.]|nr:hypothetical protein [Ramlibacter sp.]